MPLPDWQMFCVSNILAELFSHLIQFYMPGLSSPEHVTKCLDLLKVILPRNMLDLLLVIYRTNSC